MWNLFFSMLSSEVCYNTKKLVFIKCFNQVDIEHSDFFSSIDLLIYSSKLT